MRSRWRSFYVERNVSSLSEALFLALSLSNALRVVVVLVESEAAGYSLLLRGSCKPPRRIAAEGSYRRGRAVRAK